MRRRLLALVFCVTAWAIFAHVGSSWPHASDQAPADLCQATDTHAPQGAGDSERQWNAAYRADASFTESRWTSSGLHAELAAAPLAAPVVELSSLARRIHCGASRPAHLLHTPLLI